MDFVVVGFGLGALGILLGIGLRDGGRWWCQRQATTLPPCPDQDRWLVRVYACTIGGSLLAVAAAGVVLVTLLALLAGADDRRGSLLVTIASVAVCLAMGGWALIFAHHDYPRLARQVEAWRTPEDSGPPPLALAIETGARLAGIAKLPASPSPITGSSDLAAEDQALPAPLPETNAIERGHEVTTPVIDVDPIPLTTTPEELPPETIADNAAPSSSQSDLVHKPVAERDPAAPKSLLSVPNPP